MTVVVTGAAGHVGANLVRALLAQGRTVRVLIYKDRRAIEGLNVEVAEGDLREPPTLAQAFEGAQTVFHAAAHISLSTDNWADLTAVNVEGTRNVIEACRSRGVRRLVHFSSFHALEQEPLHRVVDESRPLVDSRRAPPYDRSKAAGEKIVREEVAKGLDAVILNPTGIIGPYDYKPSFLGQVLASLARGELPALVQGGCDWVDVRDVVAAALQAEKNAPSGARYILSGSWLSVCDLAAAVGQISGVRPPWFTCPMNLARASAPLITAWARLSGQRPLFTSVSLCALRSNPRINHQRAANELGYTPRPLQKTLVDTLQWFAEAGQ
jgi:dihydroflavonol-4-reductase